MYIIEISKTAILTNAEEYGVIISFCMHYKSGNSSSFALCSTPFSTRFNFGNNVHGLHFNDDCTNMCVTVTGILLQR